MKLMAFYGIFRKDHPAHGNLTRRGCTFKNPVTIEGFTLFSPTEKWQGVWARPAEGKKIVADLWECPEPAVLGFLDTVEGHPHNYKRTLVVTTDGTECEIYVCQGPVENSPFIVEVGEEWSYEARKPSF